MEEPVITSSSMPNNFDSTQQVGSMASSSSDIKYMGSTQSLVDEFKLGMMNIFKMINLGYYTIFSCWRSNRERMAYLFNKKVCRVPA